MRLTTALALSLSLSIGAATSPTQAADPANTSSSSSTSLPSGRSSSGPLDAVVTRWMRDATVPGVAIAHVRDGSIAALAAYGERAPGVPLTPDAVFNVASLTKPVFAAVVLRLVADDRFALDAPLAQHWIDPDIAQDERHRRLTTRLALSHQSGLPNWRRSTLQFAFEPGARHEYSGEGFEYTRQAVERATGASLNALAETLVLDPAGMDDTHFGWQSRFTDRAVTGYDEARAPLDITQLQTRGPNAAANLFTTVGDYARFARWVLDGAALPADLFAEMAEAQAQHADPSENFGLGWRLTELESGTVLSHDGREPGVRTQVFLAPTTREALVILTNSSHGELMVRPITAALMRDGDALLDAISRDIWTWLQHVPAEQIGPMQEGISRSPSFMSKLLHAVDVALVSKAGLTADARAAAHSAIDPFVLGMVAGEVSQDDAKALIAMLVGEDGRGLRVDFSSTQAEAWARALQRNAD